MLLNTNTQYNGKIKHAELGHVWVIEKKDGQYALYQGALDNYLVVDHMNWKGVYINGPYFLEQIIPLISGQEWITWTDEMNDRFVNLFCFMPALTVGESVNTQFIYTYIEY